MSTFKPSNSTVLLPGQEYGGQPVAEFQIKTGTMTDIQLAIGANVEQGGDGKLQGYVAIGLSLDDARELSKHLAKAIEMLGHESNG